MKIKNSKRKRRDRAHDPVYDQDTLAFETARTLGISLSGTPGLTQQDKQTEEFVLTALKLCSEHESAAASIAVHSSAVSTQAHLNVSKSIAKLKNLAPLVLSLTAREKAVRDGLLPEQPMASRAQLQRALNRIR